MKKTGRLKQLMALILAGALTAGSVGTPVFGADFGDTAIEVAAEEEAVAEEAETTEETDNSAAEDSGDGALSEDAAVPEEIEEESENSSDNSIETFTVTLDANGGYFENEWDDALNCSVDSAEVLTKNIPVGETVSSFPLIEQSGGKINFLGWSLERDGELITQGNEEYVPEENCALFAVWEIEGDSGQASDAVEDSDTAEEFDAAGDSDTAEEFDAAEVSDAVGDSDAAESSDVAEDSGDLDIETEDGNDNESDLSVENNMDTNDSEEKTDEDAMQSGLIDIAEEHFAFIYTSYDSKYIVEDIYYTGAPVYPYVLVLNNEDHSKIDNLNSYSYMSPLTGLNENEDYTVSFSDNIEVGEATVTITGIGNYTGTIITHFDIKKAPAELAFEEQSISKIVGDEPFTNPLSCMTDASVAYSSDNEDVASVDELTGMVTIHNPGRTIIRAFTEETDHYHSGEAEFLLEVGGSLGEDITWFLGSNGTLKISGTGRMYEFGENHPWDNNAVSKIMIQGDIQNIPDYAFKGCINLGQVSIPSSVTEIGQHAFDDCPNVYFTCNSNSYAKQYASDHGFTHCDPEPEVDPIYDPGDSYYDSLYPHNQGRDIAECTINLEPAEYTYDGTEKEPSVIVYDGDTELSIGTDYIVQYRNNINAGNATCLVIGKSLYDGYAKINYTIKQLDPVLTFASSSVSKTIIDSAFTNTLTKTTDGTIKYFSSNTSVATVNSSTGLVTIKGTGNTTIKAKAEEGTNYKAGSASYVLTVTNVSGLSLSDCTMTVSPTSYTYDGTEKKPTVTIKYNSTSLRNNTDYTVSYSNNINAGTGTVTATGKGGCSGTLSKTFTIGKATPALSFASSSVTKKATDPAFTNTLTKTTDGTVTFSSSNTAVATVNSSSGQVTIKGTGNTTITANAAEGNNYNAGYVSYSLTVSAGSLSDCTMTISPISYTYDGTEKKPTVTIKYNSTNLTINTDYTVSYSNNTNAGTGTVTATGKGSYSGTLSKTFTIGKASPTLSFASSSVSKKTTDSAFTNTLTKKTDGTVTFSSSNTSVATVNSSSGLVTIKGAGKTTITANAAAGTNYNAGSVSYELTITRVYTVTYNANGGTGTPSSQTKQENEALTLSSIKPSKSYKISYNSCGGSVSPASKSVNCTFKNWNTVKDGSGTSYASGGSYTANSDAILYAQWTDPKAGELAIPTRSGYAFTGWFTSASGGILVDESTPINANVTLYAHWTDPYNLGDETYSFKNYGDECPNGKDGHCFGMSMTSAGYYNKLLNISRIGGNENTPLYSFKDTPIVREPICYYQAKQGKSSNDSIVAGGYAYLHGSYNIESDWQQVVNFVKSHKYDGAGILQIGFRKENKGGHAVNFLEYKNVDGQDRIYVYDNNKPDNETWFCQDSYGRVKQEPAELATFSGAIDCIALRDVRIYFEKVKGFDSTRAIYMLKDAASVEGYAYSYMEGDFPSDEEYVMYEIPADQDRVTIIPNRDYADFIYMDTEFSFGEITDETRGELRFSSMDEQSGGLNASFIIYEEETAIKPTVTLSKTTFTYNGKVQKPTVTVKAGSTVLTESQDYIVEYPSNMVDAGTYKVKVTLIGKYSGVLYDTFEIVKGAQPIAASNLSLTYLKTGTAAVSGNKGKLTYKSSNTAVATVDSAGKVTAKGAGTAKITITAAATSNYNAATKQITVTVAKAAQSITASNLSLTFPNNGKITATGNKGSLSYRSSNTAIATVDSAGKVTAKGAGKATITITAAATSNYNAATKQITVTVAKAAQSITAKAAASSVAVGKTTTVSITGAKGTKSFKSSDTTIATVTSAGKVTAKKVGTVKITATSAATSNYNAASKTVTIKVVPSATESLTATNQATGIKLTWKKVTGANGYKVYRGSTLIKTITSGSTVTYADTKANTNGTKYTYKVVAKAPTGDSTLSKSVAVYRVARPAVSSVTNSASKKMTVKWGKNAKANGYQIQYSTDKTFKSGNKAVTVAGASTVSKVIGSLTKGKTYYVRIRTYKTVGSAKYWSVWSAAKSVKISK